MLLKWDMQTMKYRLNAVCQELPQWNKRVYKINSHTSPLITTDRITKLSPSHGLNIEAETNGDFKKTNVPLPATAFRFAGSCRETVTSCSCFVCSCGNATRCTTRKLAVQKNRTVRRLSSVESQRERQRKAWRKRKGRCHSTLKTKIWRVEIRCKTPCNFQRSWTLKSIFKTYGWFFCR